jgi:hypothetical protein
LPLWTAQQVGFFRREELAADLERYEAMDHVTTLRNGRVQIARGITEHVILDSETGGSSDGDRRKY